MAPPQRGVGPLPIEPGQQRIPRQPVERGAEAMEAQPLRARRIGGGRGIGQAERPGLGRQLTRRVDAGAIDTERARKTAQERELLKQTYGADWRNQIPVSEETGGKTFREVREALAGEHAGDPVYERAYQEMLKAREDAVERARRQLKRPRRGRGIAAGAMQRGRGVSGGVEAP